MSKPEMLTMSMWDLDRLKTVQSVVDGHLRPDQAAERLQLTDRQLRRLVERCRVYGAPGLVIRLSRMVRNP